MSHYHYFRPTLDERIEQCRCGETRRAGSVAVAPVELLPTGYKQTSREAWESTWATLPERSRWILGLYKKHGAMTDEELYDRYSDAHGGYRNTVLPTRNALYKAGFVINSGRRAKVKSGRSAIVWKLNEEVEATVRVAI